MPFGFGTYMSFSSARTSAGCVTLMPRPLRIVTASAACFPHQLAIVLPDVEDDRAEALHVVVVAGILSIFVVPKSVLPGWKRELSKPGTSRWSGLRIISCEATRSSTVAWRNRAMKRPPVFEPRSAYEHGEAVPPHRIA
jgi:hypothetical protein